MGEENAWVSHADNHSVLCLHGWSPCTAGSTNRYRPGPSLEDLHDLSRWDDKKVGTSIARYKSSLGRRDALVCQTKLLSIDKPHFNSSSAVNTSLSSRMGLIIYYFFTFLSIQLQRSGSPLIISHCKWFKVLFLFCLSDFLLPRLSQKPSEHQLVILNLLATSHQIMLHHILWHHLPLASSFTFPDRAHKSCEISPIQRQESWMFLQVLSVSSSLNYPFLLS